MQESTWTDKAIHAIYQEWLWLEHARLNGHQSRSGEARIAHALQYLADRSGRK